MSAPRADQFNLSVHRCGCGATLLMAVEGRGDGPGAFWYRHPGHDLTLVVEQTTITSWRAGGLDIARRLGREIAVFGAAVHWLHTDGAAWAAADPRLDYRASTARELTLIEAERERGDR